MLLSIEMSKHGSQGLWYMHTYLHTWQSCHHLQNLKPNSNNLHESLQICGVSGMQIDLNKSTLLLFWMKSLPKGTFIDPFVYLRHYGLRLYLQIAATTHQKGHGNIFYYKYPSLVQLLFLLVCVCW